VRHRGGVLALNSINKEKVHLFDNGKVKTTMTSLNNAFYNYQKKLLFSSIQGEVKSPDQDNEPGSKSSVPNKYLWHNAMDNFINLNQLKTGAIRDGRVGRRPFTIFC
jgi:hypothetical protein